MQAGRTSSLWVAALSVARISTLAAQDPLKLDGAQVTLPYAELKQLWDAARNADSDTKPAPPPVQAVVRSLIANLEITDESAQLEARISVESFAEDWHTIDLLSTDARLVEISPPEASVVRSDGGYALVRNESGPIELTLTFSAPRTGGAREQLLTLIPGEATVQTLTLSGIPDGRAVEIGGVLHRGKAGVLTSALPGPDAAAISLIADREPAPDAEVAPSTWNLSTQAVVRYQDGALHYEARLFARDQTGPGAEMRVQLPSHAREVVFSGEDLVSSRPERASGGVQVHPISWRDSGRLDRRFDLSFVTPVSPLAETWPFIVPRPAEEGSSAEALFVAPLAEGLAIEGEGVTTSTESQRIASWFREKLGASDFVSLQATDDVEIRPRWLPRRTTAQATIAQATFETQLEKNGQTLNQATYVVQHDNPLVWQLTLPEGCEILRCTVNGLQVAPVARDETSIEFNLTLANIESSEVQLTYSHRAEALEELEGNLVMTLPQTGLFAHAVAWSLRIPDAYVVTAVDGNLEVAADSSGSANTVSLVKRLVQAEAPTIDLFYSRPTETD